MLDLPPHPSPHCSESSVTIFLIFVHGRIGTNEGNEMGSAFSAEQKEALKASTRNMAEMLLEDLSHFRKVVSNPETSQVDVRKLTADVRRLLVNRELDHVAAPRCGRVMLKAPDYNAYYEAADRSRVVQYCGGEDITLFGHQFGAAILAEHKLPPNMTPEQYLNPMQSILGGSRKSVFMKLDHFMSQRVICFENQWITRQQAIMHIAIIGSGVHSNTPKTPLDVHIEKLRKNVAYVKSGDRFDLRLAAIFGDANWDLNINFKPGTESASTGEVQSIDPVLVEVLAAAKLVTESPSVIELEAITRSELSPQRIHRASFPH